MVIHSMVMLSVSETSNTTECQVQQEGLGNKEAFEVGVSKSK